MPQIRLKRSWNTIAVIALLSSGFALTSCGGGDGPAGPGQVRSVQLSLPSSTLDVGATLQTTIHYFDATSTELHGLTVNFSSSDAAVASVNGSGLVTGVAAGQATITATVGGAQGSVGVSVFPVPVASIQITPATPSVVQNQSITLVAQPQDAQGRPLTGRVVSWSSANPTRASVSNEGLVVGLTPGNVYIRAEAEGHKDSVSLHVRSLDAPTITGTSSEQLVPGGTGSVTGTNFGATAGENVLLVNGVPATITTASTGSLTFVVPGVTALPCTPTGPASIKVVANGDTATASMSLTMATQRSLALGESLLLTSQDGVRCNEFSVTGGRYLITTFNFGANAGVKTSFQLLGASNSGVAAQQAAPAVSAPEPPARTPVTMSPMTRFWRGHLAQLQTERDLVRSLSPGVAAARALSPATVPRDVTPNPPPAVGSMVKYHIWKTFANVTTYDTVQFRVVYVGQKVIIAEDPASPLAGQMDADYSKLGLEFDQVMYPLLLEFGDPLVDDPMLDNNGRLVALFTPRVNNYIVNGITNGIAGFVTICDFFAPADCPSSNQAEVFYALVPQPSSGFSRDTWQRIIRGTFIHEVKHIDSYAWRIHLAPDLGQLQLEDTWLEEATAQVASELWARVLYHHGQNDDIAYDEGPACDYQAVSVDCPDPAEAILNHFGFLYKHYDQLESKSILDNPFSSVDVVVYGSSWSFVRWVTDVFGGNEASFLSALMQTTDHGTSNISARAGHPFSELLGLWSLASLADNYPGAQILDPQLRLPSWNSRDIFLGMNQTLVYSDGSKPFPREWPMNERFVSFGTFSDAEKQVNLLPGGGFAAWELSGPQSTPQVLAIRSPGGGVPPASIGMAIVRIQ